MHAYSHPTSKKHKNKLFQLISNLTARLQNTVLPAISVKLSFFHFSCAKTQKCNELRNLITKLPHSNTCIKLRFKQQANKDWYRNG